MNNLAILLNFLRALAEIAHHAAAGPAFFGDHEWLADLYAAHAKSYDALIEKMRALKLDVDEFAIAAESAAVLQTARDRADLLAVLLEGEQKLCAEIEALGMEDLHEGARNFLSTLADESLGRQYQLQQRLADAKEKD